MATQSLTIERAEELIRLLTDGLVNIVDETGEFLMPLEDGTVIDTKGWGGWEWTHGIALTSLYHHAKHTPADGHSLKVALDWFETQYKASGGKGAPKNINTMSPFYCLASFLADGQIKDSKWLTWCEEWAEWIMNDLPRTKEGGFQHITYLEVNKDQLWDDTLMMTVIPLAKIGLLLNKPAYVEEAKFQFLLHIQYLMDPVSGLWFHGWQFNETGGHNFVKALWARGNCWITFSIPLFLSILDLPPTDFLYRFLASTFKRQVEALVLLQDQGSGLWHTLLIDPGSYVETSAAAGFVAGMYMGIRLGIIPESYRACADKGLAGVVANIQPDGQVAQVSFGTGMGHSFDFYREIPITSMPYGQALAMAALVEWERAQKA